MLKKLFQVVVPAVTLMGMAAIASAQLKPGSMPSFTLLFIDNVRKELALSPQQAKQIDAILEPLMTTGPNGMKGLKLNRDVDVNSLQTRCLKVLSESEKTRLRQIWLQRDGGLAASDPDVAKELGLTADQKAKVERALSEMADEMMENARSGGAPSQSMVIRKQYGEKIVGLFTAGQQKKWEAMLGKKFDFKAKSA